MLFDTLKYFDVKPYSILTGMIVLLYGIFEAHTFEHPEGLPQGAKETYERFIDNNVTPYYAFFMCFWAIYFR